MSKNWKESCWKWTCINWKYYRSICLEEMRKNTKFSLILFSDQNMRIKIYVLKCVLKCFKEGNMQTLLTIL
jgi:hypothetical protein